MRHEMRFTLEKIRKHLSIVENLVYRRSAPIPPFRFIALDSPLAVPPVGVDADDSGWETISPGSYWATWQTDFVLRTGFSVPPDWSGDKPVALFLPIGEAGDFSHPETLAYIDGESFASCDRHHQEILLPERWRDGVGHLLALHGWTGLGGEFTPVSDGRRLFMRQCAVVEIDPVTREFVALARVASGIAETLADNDPVRYGLLNALEAAFAALDLREPFGGDFHASAEAALGILNEGVAEAGAPLDADVAATGHSHIDVAWLWTLGQTRRKAGRTFHTVLRLMEQFPEYHFTQSQAQLYDYVRRDYPALFDAIKERVREGRWEVIGGMWVEADCNISGPESLARQFLLGRAFFREHFGPEAESPVLWLPDVFGYAWSLPQLIRQAGLDYFFTIKIGWSQYNRLPYDTFQWQGIDGTRVITHFSTTPESSGLPGGSSTYNAMATPAQAVGTWRAFKQKELGHELLMTFGYGDGGGGPTREMLENIRIMQSFPGAPRMSQKSAGDVFRGIEASCGDSLPVWNGELYLELHRGTYTSQARNKRANRKSEFLLHDAEFLASMASQYGGGYRYPAGELRRAWELVCLNQFHDIIPGSSIGPVYEESLGQYAEVERIAREVCAHAAESLCEDLHADVMFINPTSFSRRDIVFYKGKGMYCHALRRPDGGEARVQMTDGGCWIDPGELPPYSVTPFVVSKSSSPMETGLSASRHHLENEFVRVEFNTDGDIVRILDRKHGREALPTGARANQFQAFEDRPLEWDAWDVFIYYDDKMWFAEPAADIRVVEAGPIRASIEIKRRILSSEYTQRISLAYNSPRIDFDTVIDWRERHVMLKTAFPVDVLATEAAYEIQWGNVTRPTHRNTSWDWARFETCAQKWVDLSEGGYGVSLLNDCKYGHDIRDNVMRITLLRSPASPDPEADRGEHRFAYSLYPHEAGWGIDTIREAYALNDPVTVTLGGVVPGDGGGLPGRKTLPPFVTVDAPNVVIETVKRAEDGNGFIVRMYESMRRRGRVVLTAGFDIESACETNIIEENASALPVDGACVSFSVRPYQILTVRLVPAGSSSERG